jgi:hypothetical protein
MEQTYRLSSNIKIPQLGQSPKSASQLRDARDYPIIVAIFRKVIVDDAPEWDSGSPTS